MEEDLRLLEVGVHSVRLAATLEESLEHEGVQERKHERVGGRDRQGGTARGEGHDDAGGEDKEESRKDKEFGVHFIIQRRKF